MGPPQQSRQVTTIVITRTGRKPEPDWVAIEEALELVVEGRPIVTLPYLPGHERELCVGHLLSTGIVRDPSAVRVTRVTSGRVECVIEHRPTTGPCPPLRSVSLTSLFSCAAALQERQVVHRATGAAHAAVLCSPTDREVFFAEDIGRLNALDKAIGLAVLGGLCPSRCVAVVSGRLTGTMVEKALEAGILVLGSLAVATTAGIRTASRGGLTLVGSLRNEPARLYTEGVTKVRVPT